ncbi:MAG: signal peptidase II [Planctomycetes bacterium]|nr:signal peptidase II [Planctomycetota bacterium]
MASSTPTTDPPATSSPKWAWFWLAVVLLWVADLWSKAWAWQFWGQGPVPVFDDWLSWHTIFNPGGVFGIGRDWTVVLTVVRVIAAGVLVYLIRRQSDSNRAGLYTLGLLLAGACGNLYDNLSAWMPWDGNGQVRDFIRVDLGVPFFDPWPIFNLADSYITLGFVLLVTGLAKVELEKRT